MAKDKVFTFLSVLGIALVVAVGVAFFYRVYRGPGMITGAVTVQDADPQKQLPIADVEITVTNTLSEGPVKSDASGLFKIPLRRRLRRGSQILLKFRHPKYQPLDMKEYVDDKLYLAHLVPIAKTTEVVKGPTTAVSNVRVRYSITAMRTMNVGSAVKTFQVENIGNIPCKGQPPCSPDGKWKASIGSAALDAGMGNEFQNARVSCIAGPCPFTKVETERFSSPSRTIAAFARNWSSTATFLVEAEVVHTMQTQIDHVSYPVIFGPALNFTLPSDAEGVSLEADISGETIIFPLGPDLLLSWATCNARVNADRTNVYRCELKPGYRFAE